jgi:hypothetical protein
MKMLFGNVNVSAANTTFKVFPEIFQIVDVYITTDVFARAVIHRLVVESFFRESFIGSQFVRVNRRTLRDVFFNQRLQSFGRDVRDNFRHHLAVALQHSKHNRPVRRAASTNTMRAPADVGFINFYITEQRELTVNLRHVFTNFVADAKRAFVGNAKFALQFLRGNAVAGSGEKINRIKPQLHWRPAVFKQRSRCRVDMMAAPLARISPDFANPRPIGFTLALRAFVTLPKTAVEDVLNASGVIRERGVKFSNRYAGFLIALFHAPKLTQKIILTSRG